MAGRRADSPAGDGRMRLTLLGGFLGSGKSTWLRHQLSRGLLPDAQLLINEAADTPVDDLLLAGSQEVTVLAGGCACCTALADLVAVLRGICDGRVGGRPDRPRTDQLVLETSGLADPGPIVAAIRADTVLAFHVVVGEIVVAVDAVFGLDQLAQEPLSRRQVELADRLIVTKIDQADDVALARLSATLRALNPAAPIAAAVRGSPAPLPEFSAGDAAPLAQLGETGNALPISAISLALDDDVDWTALSVWLSALLHARGEALLRVKGVVATPAGRLLLQSVRKVMQSPEILPADGSAAGDNTLVFIGRGLSSAALARSLRHFVGSRSSVLRAS